MSESEDFSDTSGSDSRVIPFGPSSSEKRSSREPSSTYLKHYSTDLKYYSKNVKHSSKKYSSKKHSSKNENEAVRFRRASVSSFSEGSGDEITDPKDSQTTADLTDFLKIRFKAHRETPEAELQALKNKNIYSTSEIDRQLQGPAASAPAATATVDPPSEAEHVLDDNTFGHSITFGRFLLPDQPKDGDAGTEFEFFNIPKLKVGKSLLDLSTRPPGQERKGLFWVHLPVNNLLWVQECAIRMIIKWVLVTTNIFLI